MQLDVVALAYNVVDPGTLSPVADYLLQNVSDFGSAVSAITISFHFPTSGRARRTLEDDFKIFHKTRQSLPKVTFRRQKGQVSIDIASELIDGKLLEKHVELTLPIFCGLIAESIHALSLLSQRFTAQDDFHLEALLTHCRKKQSALPKTKEGFQKLLDRLETEKTAREALLSPWEKLGIDWRDYHPQARDLLDEPFFWESDNSFAPHGNDTGADLLWSYRNWLRRNPAGDPIEFYERLLKRWGYRADPSRTKGREVIDEAAVALAFAEIKLRGRCRKAVKALANESLNRQYVQAEEAVRWPHREERLQSLKLIKAKLAATD